MIIIDPKAEILPYYRGKDGDYREAERAGRVCYKSEWKISKESYDKFCKVLFERGHLTPFEHGPEYFKVPKEDAKVYSPIIKVFKNNHYSRVFTYNGDVYISSNLRILIENDIPESFINLYKCSCTKYHTPRISVKFTCSRAVSHELVRHRSMSFCQMSQRYCNYSKDRFDNNVTFISPLWIDKSEHNIIKRLLKSAKERIWLSSCKNSEKSYMKLLKSGRTPQEAREVLNNSCMTEIIMTGFLDDWLKVFSLRDAQSAHPEMQRLMGPLHKQFIDKFTDAN